MDNSTESLQEKMNALRRVYALGLPDKVSEMEHWFDIFQQNKDATEPLKTLQRLSHNLTGSGATFGFPSVSEKAGLLNSLLKAVLKDPSQATETRLQEISDSLDNLKEVSLQHLPTNSTPWFDQATPVPVSWLSHEENKRIFLVEEDPSLGKDLSLQLGYFGYQVELFSRISDIEQPMRQSAPDAIVADIGPKEAGLLIGASVPIIILSSKDDLETRLGAVRAGGRAYFSKPIDVASLADKLDSLTNRLDPDPYRILIIEDESLAAKLHSTILQSAGMVTTAVTDPMQVMHSLVEFRPDLILMDIFMPLCNGLELAAVIRQQEAYVGVPIVFCSVEQDLDKQFQALLLGGDDFLTKPVSPDRLISMVTSRAKRGRILRSHIVHDGLTGLLNHTNLKMRLNLEVARAHRHNGRLSYAMIDIDHLKSINDTYGHIAGDRVLKTVSRLLKQRFRKTDIVGRYGGDEFAAILIDADITSAVKILGEIRESFSQIRYQTKEAEFSATMSCGVASFPEHGDAESLHAVSDKALFHSKAAGGNQITPAN